MRNTLICSSILLGLLLATTHGASAEDSATYMRKCTAQYLGYPNSKAMVIGTNRSNGLQCFFRFNAHGSGQAATSALSDCQRAGLRNCFLYATGERLTSSGVMFRNTVNATAQARRQQQQRSNDAATAAFLNGVIGALGVGVNAYQQNLQQRRYTAPPRYNSGGSANECEGPGACATR